MRYNKKIFIIMFSIFMIAVLVSFSYAHFVKEDSQGNEITSINMITKSGQDLVGIANVSYKKDNIININQIPSELYSVIYKFKIDYLTNESNKMVISLQNITTILTENTSTYQLYECNENNYNTSTDINVDSLCTLKTTGYLNNDSAVSILSEELAGVQTNYYVLKVNIIDNAGKYYKATIKYGKYENPYISGHLMTYEEPYKVIEIPQNGIYKIELWGANSTGYVTRAAYTSGTIFLDMNSKLYFFIGSQGKPGVSGFNGGGAPYSSISIGGGGATDLRIFDGEASASDLTCSNQRSLNYRLMIAGGGGSNSSPNYTCGHGGGLYGYTAYDPDYSTYSATGGTQFSGGIVTNYPGSILAGTNGKFGIGGNGGGAEDGGSHGGGGGYYGGGGGSRLSNGRWPGGGGSSFISGHTGCVAIASESDESNPRITRTDSNGVLCSSSLSAGYNASGYNTDPLCSEHYSGKVFTETLMIDGGGYKWEIIDGVLVKTLEAMPNPLGGFYASGVGHTGNGYARITYIDEQ